MKQRLIGLDVDGVVADLVNPLLQAVYDRTGRKFVKEQVTEFNLANVLGEDVWQIASEILAAPGFASGLAPMEGAVEGVEMLRRFGRVVFVTSPYLKSATWSTERTNWLIRYLGAAPEDVINTADKTLFAGEVLIDDAPHHLEAWVATHRMAVRVKQPWNADAPGMPVDGWPEIAHVVEALLATDEDRTTFGDAAVAALGDGREQR